MQCIVGSCGMDPKHAVYTARVAVCSGILILGLASKTRGIAAQPLVSRSTGVAKLYAGISIVWYRLIVRYNIEPYILSGSPYVALLARGEERGLHCALEKCRLYSRRLAAFLLLVLFVRC